MADTGELITLRALQKSSLYATMSYVPGTTPQIVAYVAADGRLRIGCVS